MFGKVGRFSISYLMAIVLLVAIDCGLLRSGLENGLFAMFLMLLPTVNVMVLAIPRLRQGRPWRRFWIGFDVIGIVLTVLITVSFFWNLELAMWPIIWLGEHGWIAEKSTDDLLISIGAVLVIYSLPQFMLATFIGLFHEGFRVTIERRPRAMDPIPSPAVVES